MDRVESTLVAGSIFCLNEALISENRPVDTAVQFADDPCREATYLTACR